MNNHFKERKKKLCLLSFFSITTFVSFLLVISVFNNGNNYFDTKSKETTYTLTLDSSNKVTSSGDKVQKTALGNDVTFTYSSVAGSTSGHVTLNDNGALVNKDWIRSISSFTCTFTGGTSLKASMSYGGDVWNDGFNIESGHEYEIGSNPYYIKFLSSGTTTINSIVYKYTCVENPAAHEGEEPSDGLLGVIDFWDSDNAGDTATSTLVNASYVQARCYDSDDTSNRQSKTLVSAVSASYTYQNRYGGIGLSSKNNAASLAISLANGIEPLSVTVIAGSQSPSKTLSLNDSGKSVTANCTSITALHDDYTNTLTWEFSTAPSQLQFDVVKNSRLAIYRIYLYGEQGASWDTPKDCIGFTATDSKANSYKMTDVFDNDNGLEVTAQYDDGTSETLSRGGVDGYSYEVRDYLNDELVDTSNDFGNIGGNNQKSYYVIVSYKNFIPVMYDISVSFVTKLTEIIVNSNILEYNTAQTLNTSEISADLRFNKTTLNVDEVPYASLSEYDLSLTLLDPTDVVYPVSNIFGSEGTWKIKIASNEYPSVYGTLEIHVNAIPVTAISVSGAGGVATVEEESTLQLTAAVTPNNATYKTVEWTTSSSSVATVNTNGLVTGVSAGNARITATAIHGSEVYGYLDVTVTKKPAQSEFDASMTPGDNASDVTVNGHTAVKVGTSKNSGSMTITVGAGATSLTFYAAGWNGTSTSISLTPEDSISPNNISLTADTGISGNSPFTLASQTEEIYLKTCTLTNINSETTISIAASTRFVVWGAKYYTTQVDPVYPTSISLSGDQSISVGGTSLLSVSYSPSDTNVRNVTFTSNNTSVATVSSGGIVTGVSAGSAKITATAEAANSGTVSAEINITVSAVSVTGVSLNKNALTLHVAEYEQLTATIAPVNAGNQNVTWTTSDSSVATVANGLVTGMGNGTATITVTTADGGYTATCAVTVIESSGGGGASGSATISVSDIPTTYNTTSGNTSADGFTFTSYNVASSYTSGSMQWKKSSGYIENTTAIDGLISITIEETSGKSFAGTLYSGTSASPSGNSQSVSSGNTYTFSGNPSYFKLEVGSSTGYTGDISLAYSTTPVDPTSISVSPSNLELTAGGTRDLEVSYLPTNANQNKEVTWSRYSGSSLISVSTAGKVSVASNASSGATAVIRATLVSNSSIYSSCTVTVVEQTQDDQTILIYICGSDLESNGQTSASSAAGYASGDITEILKVGSQPDDVNVVIETGGAKCWKTTHGINKNYLERYHVSNKSLVRDSQETKANMGLTSTLQSFVTWGVQTYPADRVSLILWNHGGAMRGVCYDENYSSDSLTNSEVKTAIGNSFSALGRSSSDKFEWIGYDACLMQVQDIAEFNSQYFNYMIASEESEAGAGWDYDNWLDDAYLKKSTPNILKAICDSFLAEQGSSSDQTLSYLDLSYMSAYKSAWETMASTINSLISSYGKSKFQTLMKTVQYYGSDSDCEGYSYFGILDAKDVLNKLKNTSAFSSASTQINNALTAFTNLVAYSKAGTKAGNSYGLCCFFPMKDGSGYTCNTSSVYTSSQTNFTSWRSIVTSYGD